MKTEWICSWQLIPGGVEQTKTFSTQETARKAMAKVLTDAVDLKGYINALRNEEGEDCGSSADFLEKFLSDLTIPNRKDEVPPHLEIPDHCLLEISPDEGFRWGYMRKECPLLVVSHVYYGSDGHPFIVDFGYENPKVIGRGRINAVYIRIDEHVSYGTSAYPLLVWWAVHKEPRTQKQIVRAIRENWNIVIDRKAVGRHLQLLQDLGFPVQHGLDGYYNSGDPHPPKTDIKCSPSAYPLLILQELDHTPKTQMAIIRSIQEKYGPKMDRKAVRRHLKLLEALGVHVEKCEDGYYIEK